MTVSCAVHKLSFGYSRSDRRSQLARVYMREADALPCGARISERLTQAKL
jgi:hypothetical protein